MGRIGIRVKKCQVPTRDSFPRAQCRDRRSVRGHAVASANLGEKRVREATWPQAAGVGWLPRSSGIRAAVLRGRRTHVAEKCSRLVGRPPPPALQLSSLVQWEHPNSLDRKPCQMENDAKKLGHRTNMIDSQRSWTTHP